MEGRKGARHKAVTRIAIARKRQGRPDHSKHPCHVLYGRISSPYRSRFPPYGSIQLRNPAWQYTRTQRMSVRAMEWPRAKRKRLPSWPTILVAEVATLMDWGEIILPVTPPTALEATASSGGMPTAVAVVRCMLEKRALEEKRKAEEAAAALLLAEQKAKEAAAFEKVPEAILESRTPSVRTVQTDEGAKNVIKITMELVEDHIPKRAEKFKDMISKHSSVYSVDEPLVYAIMEQESAFNPQAQSWVPAYGLMQLVPKSGGRDAYRFVHNTDAIPSADFLFNPDNNIQLGTGYLKLLMSTTFKKVEDPRCRMLCAIAAYNTGAGNVSRAINGTTNISKAIPSINKMSYDQLFNHLKNYLPHDETKDYIRKVTSKMQKYIK